MGKIKWIIIFAVLVVLGFVFRGQIFNFSTKYLPEIQKKAEDFFVEEIKTNISLPPPLRITQDAPKSFLTSQGVIKFTNVQRTQNNEASLRENSKLNAAASAKVKDMFEKQFFAHVAPDGTDASVLAKREGYDAIMIGENLALGNFSDDEALVQAWMNSPGHRENILNAKYQEIGVAVGKGSFEGKSTWLAVQIFGLPQSACPQPDRNLKAQIDANQNTLQSLEQTLQAKRSEIDNMQPQRGDEYNQKVDEYNQLVAQYNALLEQTKTLVNQYNAQVRAFNDCAG